MARSSYRTIFVWFGLENVLRNGGIKIGIRRETLILWDYFINLIIRSPQGQSNHKISHNRTKGIALQEL